MSNPQRAVAEDRRCPRIPAGLNVHVVWGPGGAQCEASGRCLDISKGGAAVQIPEAIPVSTSVCLRFDELGLEAVGDVRHSSEGGIIGVEFTRLVWHGSRIKESRSRARAQFSRLSMLVLTGVIFVTLAAGLCGLATGGQPFSRRRLPEILTDLPVDFGSSRLKVHATEGQPTTVADAVWHYLLWKIAFIGDRLAGSSSISSSSLKPELGLPGAGKINKLSFSIGSTESEVLKVQGSPTEKRKGAWRYEQSEVYFRGGRVVGWKNSPGHPLSVAPSGVVPAEAGR